MYRTGRRPSEVRSSSFAFWPSRTRTPSLSIVSRCPDNRMDRELSPHPPVSPSSTRVSLRHWNLVPNWGHTRVCTSPSWPDTEARRSAPPSAAPGPTTYPNRMDAVVPRRFHMAPSPVCPAGGRGWPPGRICRLRPMPPGRYGSPPSWCHWELWMSWVGAYVGRYWVPHEGNVLVVWGMVRLSHCVSVLWCFQAAPGAVLRSLVPCSCRRGRLCDSQ